MNPFKYNSALQRFMGSLADFILLNFLFMISCIPIVTIGPALNAMYSILISEARHEHVPFFKTYRIKFKENISRSLILSIIMLITGVILSVNLFFWMQFKSIIFTIIFVIIVLIMIIYISVFPYVFALNARYDESVGVTLKNALYISMAYISKTMLIHVITALIASILYFVVLLRIPFFLFGFSYILYCDAYIINKIFEKIEKDNSSE